MPDDENILGFSNKWYKEALESALPYPLTKTLTIKLVRPEYFVATKFEAYLGRGNNDPLESRDIEDILTLFDGRASIVGELATASPALHRYVAAQFDALLSDRNFEFAVKSAAGGDTDREALIFERITSVVAGTGE